jgi:hypothetical protein
MSYPNKSSSSSECNFLWPISPFCHCQAVRHLPCIPEWLWNTFSVSLNLSTGKQIITDFVGVLTKVVFHCCKCICSNFQVTFNNKHRFLYIKHLLLLISGMIIQTTVHVSANFHALGIFVYIPTQWSPGMIAVIFTKGESSFYFIHQNKHNSLISVHVLSF